MFETFENKHTSIARLQFHNSLIFHIILENVCYVILKHCQQSFEAFKNLTFRNSKFTIKFTICKYIFILYIKVEKEEFLPLSVSYCKKYVLFGLRNFSINPVLSILNSLSRKLPLSSLLLINFNPFNIEWTHPSIILSST